MRSLEREIANLARKAVKEIVTKKTKKVAITRKNLEKYAGVRKFRYGETEAEDMVGVVTGLAWTEVGGEILTIESVLLPGKGKMTAHRQARRRDAGERVGGAELCPQPRSITFGIKPTRVREARHPRARAGGRDAEGRAVRRRRDGDRIVSVLTGIPVRRDVAMTGEITLRGRVLPIGGLKEKLLAALRAGINTVFIPKENEKDLAEIPENVKKHLKIIPVAHVDDVSTRRWSGSPSRSSGPSRRSRWCRRCSRRCRCRTETLARLHVEMCRRAFTVH